MNKALEEAHAALQLENDTLRAENLYYRRVIAELERTDCKTFEEIIGFRNET